ncbi:MAG: hypothetical protein U0271_17620 [Polyangiaceae bacterium]
MNTARLLLCASLLTSASGCFFADDILDDLCLDESGYLPGVHADRLPGIAEDPESELRGTHELVQPAVLAAGAQEGLLIEVPRAVELLDVEVDGNAQVLETNDICTESDESSFVKFQIEALDPGPVQVRATTNDGYIAVFSISVETATALHFEAPRSPFIVGQTTRICAFATGAGGTQLYADDSLSMSADGSVTLSILDPGGACRSITPNAAGAFELTIEGLGLSETATFEAVEDQQGV